MLMSPFAVCANSPQGNPRPWVVCSFYCELIFSRAFFPVGILCTLGPGQALESSFEFDSAGWVRGSISPGPIFTLNFSSGLLPFGGVVNLDFVPMGSSVFALRFLEGNIFPPYAEHLNRVNVLAAFLHWRLAACPQRGPRDNLWPCQGPMSHLPVPGWA